MYETCTKLETIVNFGSKRVNFRKNNIRELEGVVGKLESKIKELEKSNTILQIKKNKLESLYNNTVEKLAKLKSEKILSGDPYVVSG